MRKFHENINVRQVRGENQIIILLSVSTTSTDIEIFVITTADCIVIMKETSIVAVREKTFQMTESKCLWRDGWTSSYLYASVARKMKIEQVNFTLNVAATVPPLKSTYQLIRA